jgi:FKBP-type peptidyl-prolyl cis-trans isomerase FkpA
MHPSIALAVVLLCIWAPLASAAEELETDDQKTLYAIGWKVAQGLTPLALNETEIEDVLNGIRDAALERPSQIEVGAYDERIGELLNTRRGAAAEAEKQASASFVASAAAQSGATTTASGLVFRETGSADGPKPKATDTVEVHYHGTLRDGTVFDSSVERGEPARFPLNRVIPCWTEALQMISVGGKATIVCPADIAYGDRGAPGGKIAPGAALQFEVELLSIAPADAPGS